MASQPPAPSWKKFSQSEALTVRLRNILHDYAFGPGVFRELLQNADDAGASKLVLVADGRTWPSSTEAGGSLLDDRLADWQGPGLMAFNDAVFTDKDFDGICSVGASGKRGDASKIGQYGLGFNATYHLSDVVSFVSRDRLCIFDPHERHLPDALPGLQLGLTDATSKQYGAQLAPFEATAAAVGASCWPLQGAIFRLPLRSPALACKSKICQESHDFEDLLGVLRELLKNAHELLLFLQNVESVEVRVVPPGAALDAQTQLVGKVSLKIPSGEASARLRAERRLFSALGAGPAVEDEGATSKDPSTSLKRAAYTFATEEHEVKENSEVVSSTSVWLVISRAEPAPLKKKQQGPEDDMDSVILDTTPGHYFGSVAVRLSPTPSVVPVQGQAFCYLPLAIATGLPMHVSANFALTANRRDLWRRSDDELDSNGNLRALWNEHLLTTTLPRTIADALAVCAGGDLSASLTAANTFACLDPAIRSATDLVTRSPTDLWALLPARSALTSFEIVPKTVCADVVQRNIPVFYDASADTFVGAKAALLVPSTAYRRLSEPLRDALRKVPLGRERVGLVEVPESHVELLQGLSSGCSWLSPGQLSHELKGKNLVLDRPEVDAMVEYLVGTAGSLSHLIGLRLCPILGNDLAFFAKQGSPEHRPIWWHDDAAMSRLVPGHAFVDSSTGTFRLLHARIPNACLNIRFLTSKSVPTILPGLIPQAWKGAKRISETSSGIVLVDGTPAEEVQANFEEAQERAEIAAQEARAAAQAALEAQGGSEGWRPKNKKKKGGKASKPWQGGDDGDDDDLDSWWAQGGGEAWEDSAPGATTAQPSADGREDGEGALPACTCTTLAELNDIVERCQMLWKILERVDRGTNVLQLLSEWPCLPLAEQKAGADGAPIRAAAEYDRLIVFAEASRSFAFVEDFTGQDRLVLEAAGLSMFGPLQSLRKLLGGDRDQVLRSLDATYTARWKREGAPKLTGLEARLLKDMKFMRVPAEEGRALREMIVRWLNKRKVSKDLSMLGVLPLFETQGSNFFVPLVPNSARILPPDEDWEEALRPQFSDFLLSFDGEAGELLELLGRDRGSMASFLAEFACPRAGVFDQSISLKFLRAVAQLRPSVFHRTADKMKQMIAKTLLGAPVVVYANGERRLCSKLADPGRSELAQALGEDCVFPPREYLEPDILAVLRQAGLRSFNEPAIFLQAMKQVSSSGGGLNHQLALSRMLLEELGRMSDFSGWSTSTFTSIGRLEAFPAMRASPDALYPPTEEEVDAILFNGPDRDEHLSLVSMDVPALFEHRAVTWTQAPFHWPKVVETWRNDLRKKFGSLKSTPSLTLVSANLKEVISRWLRVPEVEEADVKRRQTIVAEHLSWLQKISKRNRATQTMVQGDLSGLAFVVLDQGQFVKPCDIFNELHAGGDSDDEEDEEDGVLDGAQGGQGGSEDEAAAANDDEWQEVGAGTNSRQRGRNRQSQQRQQQLQQQQQQQQQSQKKKSKKKAGAKGPQRPWSLPPYLRPYRSLLLAIAGPVVDKREPVPRIVVSEKPNAALVPKFMADSLNKPELADVEFVVFEEDGSETVIYAHRLILAAASEHFMARFTSGLSNRIGSSGRIRLELEDWVTTPALLWVLAYLYQGFDPQQSQKVAFSISSELEATRAQEVSNPAPPTSKFEQATRAKDKSRAIRAMFRETNEAVGEHLCCLLRLADKYNLEHLKDWSSEKLAGLLTPGNVMALSTHAYFCSAQDLLRVCVYNLRLVYSEIARSAEWETLEPGVKDLVLGGLGTSTEVQ